MEWWKLWVPFIGTLITAIINVWLSYTQKKKSQEFDLKLREKQNEFEKNMTKQKIDADIISKSRIHWMDETKQIVTEFLNTSLSLGSLSTLFAQNCLRYRQYEVRWEHMKEVSKDTKLPSKERKLAKEIYEAWENGDRAKFIEKMNENSKLINETLDVNKKNYMLLKLNFSDNDENNQIIELVKEIHEDLRKISLFDSWIQTEDPEIIMESIARNEKSRDRNALKTNELVQLLRVYYKREWEKVKLGQ